jgi:AhpD family alkylhydroperoxidase
MGRDFHSTECVRLLGVSGLHKALTELIKVRASQVSGYSFCMQLPLKAARIAKVPQTKLDAVAVWREAGTSVHVRSQRLSRLRH